jgi:hypothetical protein
MKKHIANTVVFVRTRPLTTIVIVAAIAATVYSENVKRANAAGASLSIDTPDINVSI